MWRKLEITRVSGKLLNLISQKKTIKDKKIILAEDNKVITAENRSGKNI